MANTKMTNIERLRRRTKRQLGILGIFSPLVTLIMWINSPLRRRERANKRAHKIVMKLHKKDKKLREKQWENSLKIK